jgi:hypothetical protein
LTGFSGGRALYCGESFRGADFLIASGRFLKESFWLADILPAGAGGGKTRFIHECKKEKSD